MQCVEKGRKKLNFITLKNLKSIVLIVETAIHYIKENIKGFIGKGKNLMEKTCKTCIRFCLNKNDGKVCNQYKTEVQEILEGIDKILEEGYQDWEGMR